LSDDECLSSSNALAHHCLEYKTMDTTINQQVAMDEALISHAQRLRIGRSNFHLLSDIKSKESTLQLVYDVLRLAAIRMLTDVNINKLYQPWRSFAAIINKCLTGKSSGYDSLRLSQAQILIRPFQPPTRSSSDTTITPPTAAVGPRLTTAQKGKQAAKASKAKSLSAHFEVAMTEAQQPKPVTKRSLQQTHISQASGSGVDEGTGSIPGVLDVPTDESEEELSWSSTDDEGDDDKGKDSDGDEEDNGDDGEEGDGDNDDEDDNGEEGDDDQEVVRDDDKDDEEEGMESIFETTSQMDVQTPTSVAPLSMSAPTMTPSTIATITTTSQAPILPTTTPSTIIQNLPNFSSLFGFDNRLRTLEANFFEFMQTNQFAEAVSTIPGINVNEKLEAKVLTRSSNSSKTFYVVAADLSKMELKKILIEKIEGNKSIQRSNEQRNLYKALVEAYEPDKIILDTYGETVTLKRRRDDDADKDEKPSAGPDRGSKRRREGKKPESASAPTETATRSAGRSTQ
nr:hypothetical protein [Tanacetum cinerariifolium]